MQLDDKITSLFQSKAGGVIYDTASSMVSAYGMDKFIERGVLLGLSGGADSVMLLCFLLEYRRRNYDFPLLCVHINHCIRGDEAYRDENFSRELCESLNVEFVASRQDIPTLSQKFGVGVEECARNVRYSEFTMIISSRKDISSVAVAHNADDNLETMLLNMLRGGGSRGLAGIPPVRGNIFRPLISVCKSDIVAALSSFDIPFVTDSTNLSNDYKRNYIRNEILPMLRKLSLNPEAMAVRASANLRSDDDFINSVAREFLLLHPNVRVDDLRDIHKAVFARVLSLMCDGISLSSSNIDGIRDLLRNENFSYSLPEGARFIAEYGVCRVERKSEISDYYFRLTHGCNNISEYGADIILSDEKIDKTFVNVYKISIQADLSSAIIEGDLYIRPKRDGDTVFYGGITRKLKKLYNDRKIPPSYRNDIPVLCDSKGVVWIPGFGVRDDGACKSDKKPLYVFIGISAGDDLSSVRFRLGTEF